MMTNPSVQQVACPRPTIRTGDSQAIQSCDDWCSFAWTVCKPIDPPTKHMEHDNEMWLAVSQ